MITTFCPWCKTEVELDTFVMMSSYLCEECRGIFILVPDSDMDGIKVVKAKSEFELAQAS